MRDYAQYLVTPEVLDSFDLIGFDPRGVNHSTPVVCYTDPADQDELLYGTYDDPYGSEGWLEELTEREADWAAACAENTGPLLGHIDAGSVARDMDVIRAVLGDSKINYLGFSYGTYLGTMYAELFPEKVGRMVLDGAVDPTVSDLDALATQMAGFDGKELLESSVRPGSSATWPPARAADLRAASVAPETPACSARRRRAPATIPCARAAGARLWQRG